MAKGKSFNLVKQKHMKIFAQDVTACKWPAIQSAIFLPLVILSASTHFDL